jgi:hypothetical protein
MLDAAAQFLARKWYSRAELAGILRRLSPAAAPAPDL